MRSKLSGSLLAAIVFSSVALAQMHGGSSGSMGGTNSGRPSMPGSMSQRDMGPMGQDQNMSPMTPAQRRQAMHTTTMQDQQYAKCIQRMNSVMHHIGNLMHEPTSFSPASFASDNSNSSDGIDALSSDMQDMEQEDNGLVSGFNDDQTAALAGQLKSLEKSTKEMQALTDHLRTEMADKDTDPKVIHRDLKKLEKLAKQVSKQQHEIGVAPGIVT